MMPNFRKIDHIVYAVPNLEKAILDFETRSGIKPFIGGRHLNQGTKNAIVNIGNHAYLEFIAIDTENDKIKPPRWMGIDLIKKAQITRWSIKTKNIAQDASILKKHKSALGRIHEGQRKTENGQLLSWQMTLPLSHPKVELIPFSLNWEGSDFHPCDKLPPQCDLKELILFHPEPESLTQVFKELNIEQEIGQAEKPKIKITLLCPKGEIIL